METKHTPGPWKARAKNFDATAFTITNESGQMLIGETYSFDADEQSIANAKLMAAAPRMLESLQSSLWILEKIQKNVENKPGGFGEWLAGCQVESVVGQIRNVMNSATE